jgi:hypothetical protein
MFVILTVASNAQGKDLTQLRASEAATGFESLGHRAERTNRQKCYRRYCREIPVICVHLAKIYASLGKPPVSSPRVPAILDYVDRDDCVSTNL